MYKNQFIKKLEEQKKRYKTKDPERYIYATLVSEYLNSSVQFYLRDLSTTEEKENIHDWYQLEELDKTLQESMIRNPNVKFLKPDLALEKLPYPITLLTYDKMESLSKKGERFKNDAISMTNNQEQIDFLNTTKIDTKMAFLIIKNDLVSPILNRKFGDEIEKSIEPLYIIFSLNMIETTDFILSKLRITQDVLQPYYQYVFKFKSTGQLGSVPVKINFKALEDKEIEAIVEAITDSTANSLGASALSEVNYFLKLLSCKNIIVKDATLNTKANKRRPELDYKEIHIKVPSKTAKILNKETIPFVKKENSSIKTKRGHFKTYTEDNPLFGKYTGTWWWDPIFDITKPPSYVVEKDTALLGEIAC